MFTAVAAVTCTLSIGIGMSCMHCLHWFTDSYERHSIAMCAASSYSWSLIAIRYIYLQLKLLLSPDAWILALVKRAIERMQICKMWRQRITLCEEKKLRKIVNISNVQTEYLEIACFEDRILAAKPKDWRPDVLTLIIGLLSVDNQDWLSTLTINFLLRMDGVKRHY